MGTGATLPQRWCGAYWFIKIAALLTHPTQSMGSFAGRYGGIVLVLVLGPVQSLAGQVDTDSLPPRPNDSVAFSLPDLSALTDRQPKNFFDTPLAVTAVQPSDRYGANGYGLDDALNLVPGVLAQSRYGNQDIRLVIRGFGARGAGDRSNAGTS